MKLEDVRKEVYYYSEKASQSNNKLALVGIGIIWIFREINEDKTIIFSIGIGLALLFFVLSLSIDLINYTIQAPRWDNFYHRKKDEKKSETEDVGEPAGFGEIINWGLFFLKIAFVVAAYIILAFKLYNQFNFT